MLWRCQLLLLWVSQHFAGVPRLVMDGSEVSSVLVLEPRVEICLILSKTNCNILDQLESKRLHDLKLFLKFDLDLIQAQLS